MKHEAMNVRRIIRAQRLLAEQGHAGDTLGALDELAALRKDAERYRWLRAQHWDTAELCVVMDPKDAVKLGRTCPSGEYLDIAVDDAILIGRAVGAA